MALRTEESFQLLLSQTRQRQAKKKLKEQQKYKQAQQSTKKAIKASQQQQKALAYKLTKEEEKRAQKALKCHISIYHSRYVDRHPADDEVYLTREELQDAEDRGEGKINWGVWDELVNNVKQKLKRI